MWYKIVESGEDIGLRTLFYGNGGSRTLATKKWLRAAEKVVHDGSNGTPYTSGWHVLPTKTEAENYLKQFKKDRRERLIVIRVWAQGVYKKEHSRSPVYLAREIYIGKWPDDI